MELFYAVDNFVFINYLKILLFYCLYFNRITQISQIKKYIYNVVRLGDKCVCLKISQLKKKFICSYFSLSIFLLQVLNNVTGSIIGINLPSK